MKKFIALLIVLAASLSFAQVQQTTATLGNSNKFTSTNFFLNGLDTGPVTFSQLGFVYATGTTFVRCTDCQQTNPCLGGGSGSFALYINGSWSCTTGGGTGSGFTTAAEVVAAFSGCSDADYLGADTACHAIVSSSTCVNAAGFSGSSIVEQIQSAVTSLASAPGCVTYPPGQYTADDPSNWQTTSGSLSHVGILLATGQSIIGPGQDLCITVPYTGNVSAAVMANLHYGTVGIDSNIGVNGVCINWNTTLPAPDKQSYIAFFQDVTGLRVQNDSFSGNPNELTDFDDDLASTVDHDNFYLYSADAFYGVGAVGVNRFTSTPYTTSGYSVTVADNFLQETNGSGGTIYPYSMIVVGGNNADIEHNRCDIYSLLLAHPTNQNCLEIGLDGFGDESYNVAVRDNSFQGGSVIFPLNASHLVVTNNSLEHSQGIGFAPTGGSFSVGSDGVISGNTVQCDGYANCGINIDGCQSYLYGTSNPHDITISGNHIFGGSIGVEDCSFSDTITGNDIHNSAGSAMQIAGARTVTDNKVVNANQANPTAENQGIVIGGTSPTVSTSGMTELSGNSVTDDQVTYSTGTVCSVSFGFYTGPGTTCLTSGTSRWLYCSGCTWSQGWTNPSIYIGGTAYPITGFSPDGVHVELTNYIPYVAAGTTYKLQNTIWQALLLNGLSIESMQNNVFKTNTSSGWPGGYAVACSGTVTTGYYANNVTNYGAGVGSCPANFFVPPPPNQDLTWTAQIIWTGTGYQPAGIWTPNYDVQITGFEVSTGASYPTCTTYPVVELNEDPSDPITLNSYYTTLLSPALSPFAAFHPYTNPARTPVNLIVSTQGVNCSGGQNSPTLQTGTATSSGSTITSVTGSNFSQMSVGSLIYYNGALYTVTISGSSSVTVVPSPGTNSSPITWYSSYYAVPPTYQATVHYVCTGCN